MNHNEHGTYLAPRSRDHAASSIAKARSLIAPLVEASLRRNASVTIVPWNYKVQAEITFAGKDFVLQQNNANNADEDEEKDEEIDVVALRASIALRCGDSAQGFVAHGKTNIEAALQKIDEIAQREAANGVTRVTAWFLTDGGETVYQDAHQKPQRIPVAQNDPEVSFVLCSQFDDVCCLKRFLLV